MGLMTRNVKILSGAALSDKLYCEGFRVTGFLMPDVWTAANLTFLAADTGQNDSLPPADADFEDVYDKGGTEYAVVVPVLAAGRTISISPLDLAAVRWLRVRSGTGALPVNQAADRTIGVLLVPEA